ncbi:mercuric transporter MerT family protein [Halobacteriovorax sp.]|uniref:mercuric transporter MerT family protein n=1 Tax=Halobacteriovorax sp. TaxID=2020862 RepID=UPI003AF2C246
MENKAQKATLVGGMIASITAASCCIGPVLFALLGFSSAGLLTKMEPYRPYLTILTLVLLGLSFYFTYRKKATEKCDPDSYCASPQAERWNKFVLWSVAILTLVFLTFPYWSIYLV